MNYITHVIVLLINLCDSGEACVAFSHQPVEQITVVLNVPPAPAWPPLVETRPAPHCSFSGRVVIPVVELIREVHLMLIGYAVRVTIGAPSPSDRAKTA